MEQKIKQDAIHIGANIRRVRLERGIGQTELVRRLQFLSAAKEKRKRNAAKNCVFGFPCAASSAAYPACFHHADVVLCKLHRNVALSMLL